MSTKFEQVGIDLQTSSETIKEAERRFSTSCRVCCNSGINIPCDKCGIAAAHSNVVAALHDINAAIKNGGHGFALRKTEQDQKSGVIHN